MVEPVTLHCCGSTFEKQALATWFELHAKCPICRARIPKNPSTLAVSKVIRDLVEKKVGATSMLALCECAQLALALPLAFSCVLNAGRYTRSPS
jgi:hypothetical protein